MTDLFNRIVDAHRALRPGVMTTPLLHSPMLSDASGCNVYLKCEHLQHTGSFKFRGASNKLRLLDAACATRGVFTASSGNHGQGVALAGREAGYPVTVYVSAATSAIKIAAIRALGAQIKIIDAPHLAVEQLAKRDATARGCAFVHPYDDLDVIAGQGTAGVELCEQAQAARIADLAAVFVSVGGGGLISGIGTAVQTLLPATEVVGCWAANAPALYCALQAGRVIDTEESPTIADGVSGGVEPGSATLPIAQRVVTRMQRVDEMKIRAAMRVVAQTDRWMVEGAAGVALGAMLELAPHYRGRAVAVVLCGRNISIEQYIDAVR